MVESPCPACPGFFKDWDSKASELSATHEQRRCPTCKLWTLWVPKEKD